MGSVIGDVLPLAVGVAISPMPIIAVILMLLAPRAGAASAGFLAGWVAGVVVTATVVTIIADTGPRLAAGASRATCSLRPCAGTGGVFVVRGTGTAPEWNVRLKPWGGREDHDYGRNDQS